MKNNSKNAIIIILSIVLTIMLLISIIITSLLFLNNSTEKTSIDGSKMPSTELIQMFQNEGYEIELTNIDNILYIILKNKKEGITIQRIPNTSIGTLMTFKDENINDYMADILDFSYNDTTEKKEQYKTFQNWLNYYNITKVQLSTMLDYYHTANKDKINYIDSKDFLNN